MGKFDAGSLVYWADKNSFDYRKYVVNFGIVDYENMGYLYVKYITHKKTIVIDGVDVDTMTFPTEHRKLPKGFKYNTRLFEYDEVTKPEVQEILRNTKISEKEKIEKYYREGIFVDDVYNYSYKANYEKNEWWIERKFDESPFHTPGLASGTSVAKTKAFDNYDSAKKEADRLNEEIKKEEERLKSGVDELYDNYVRCNDCEFRGKNCKRSNGVIVKCDTPICCDFKPGKNYKWLYKNWTSFEDFWEKADHEASGRNDSPNAVVKFKIPSLSEDTVYKMYLNDWVYGHMFDGNKLRIVGRTDKVDDSESFSGHRWVDINVDGISIPNYTPTPEQTQTPAVKYPEYIAPPEVDPDAPPTGCDPDIWFGRKPNARWEMHKDFLDEKVGKYGYDWQNKYGSAQTYGDRVMYADIWLPHRCKVRCIGSKYYIEWWRGSHCYLYTNDPTWIDSMNRHEHSPFCFPMDKERALKILDTKIPDCVLWNLTKKQILNSIEMEDKDAT